MDDREKRVLAALAMMVSQYLEKRPDGTMDNYAMSAGERAFSALAEYGYMEDLEVRFGRWTEAGEALLAWGRSSFHTETFPSQPPTA